MRDADCFVIFVAVFCYLAPLRTSAFLCRAKQTTTRRSIHSLTTRTPSTQHPPHEISIGYRRVTMALRERRKFFSSENTITNTPVLPAPDCHRLLTSVLADHVCYLCNRSSILRQIEHSRGKRNSCR